MRKVSALFGALLLATLGATSANAQSCIDFVDFCDGVQVTFGPQFVAGTWESYDCAGSTWPVQGFRVAGGAGAAIVCSEGGCFTGFEVLLSANFPQARIDLYDLFGNFLNTTPITVTPGACPFGPAEDGAESLTGM
jgi:hypothetical protein